MQMIQSPYGKVEIIGDEYSSIKQLVAIANDGYCFFTWSGDTEGIDERSSAITADMTYMPYRHLYANFRPDIIYVAYAQSSLDGTVDIEENEIYPWQKTFVAKSNPGHRFEKWIEIGTNRYIDIRNETVNPLWIEMTQENPSLTLSAIFSQDVGLTQIVYEVDGECSYSYIDIVGTLNYNDFDVYGGYPHNEYQQDNTIISIKLGNKINSLGKNCFCNCTNLTSISISNRLTSIGEGAFKNTGLVSIDFSMIDSNAICSDTFYRTNILNVCNVCSSINAIGENAFYGCDQLTGVSLPSSISTIGSYAFYNCINLISIDLRDFQNFLPQIHENSFMLTAPSNRQIYLNSTRESMIAYESQNVWKNLYADIDPQIDLNLGTILTYYLNPQQTITLYGQLLSGHNLCSVDFNGTIRSFEAIDNSNLLTMTYKNQSSSSYYDFVVSVQNSLSSIACGINAKCTSISSFGINIHTLPDEAFANMSLAKVTIPNNIDSIGIGAFYGNHMTIDDIYATNCEKLYDNWLLMPNGDCVNLFCESNITEFNVNGDKPIKSFTKLCFSGCTAFQSICIPSTLTSIVSPLIEDSSQLTNLQTIKVDQQNKYFKAVVYAVSADNMLILYDPLSTYNDCKFLTKLMTQDGKYEYLTTILRNEPEAGNH